MRTVAFYRVRTDGIDPQFGICLEKKGDVDMPYYMHGDYTTPDPRDPGMAHLQMLIARMPAPELVPKELFVARFSYSSRNKPVDPKKIPDLWTSGISLASERFLDVIGEEGRECVETRPIELFDLASGQRFQRKYFALTVRKVAMVEPLEYREPRPICDAKRIIPEEMAVYESIVFSNSIKKYMSQLDIWTLYQFPYAVVFSRELGKRLLESKLVGFKEIQGFKRGDVSHVWATAPSPDARVGAVHGSAGPTAASRSAASVAS